MSYIIPKRIADGFNQGIGLFQALNERHAVSGKTAEQRARDMLEQCGVEDAQSFTAGDVVALANLIAEVDQLRAGPWVEHLPEFERQLRAAAKDSVETKCGRIQTREVRVGYELGIVEGIRLALGVYAQLGKDRCPIHSTARECQFYGQSMAAGIPGIFEVDRSVMDSQTRGLHPAEMCGEDCSGCCDRD